MQNRDVVVLTGATGGLGQAFAHALLPRCSKLLLMGRKADALEHLAQQLQNTKNNTIQIHTLAGDNAAPSTLTNMQQWAVTHGCTLLIANAGINHFGDAIHTPFTQQAAIVHSNLVTTIQQCQAILPSLLAAPHAQLVLVGSMLGYMGYPGNAAYCASKFGLRGYAQALQRELAHNLIQVKYFAPRAINTPMNQGSVHGLHQALGIQADTPDHVAMHLLRCLESQAHEYKIGFPERLYAWLNQLWPSLVHTAIAKQLPTIKQHFPNPKLHINKETPS